MPFYPKWYTCAQCHAVKDSLLNLCNRCWEPVCHACWLSHAATHYRPVLDGLGRPMFKPSPLKKPKPKKSAAPSPTGQGDLFGEVEK
jgi:hypothetical protein